MDPAKTPGVAWLRALPAIVPVVGVHTVNPEACQRSKPGAFVTGEQGLFTLAEAGTVVRGELLVFQGKLRGDQLTTRIAQLYEMVRVGHVPGDVVRVGDQHSLQCLTHG